VATETNQENYYRLLNVDSTATSAEITRAYRIAMKRAHPDHAHPTQRQAAEEITKELNRAYSVLSNPDRRQSYDRTIRRSAVQDQIMNRYVSGLGGPAATASDPFATHLRRPITEREKRERRMSDRSAMYSLFSVFVVLLIGGLGLLAMFAVISYLVSLL
jgi:DnaJ-class molecular chaperone